MRTDLKQLIQLQELLFPVRYGPSFYEKLFRTKVSTLLAFTPYDNELVGVATGRIRFVEERSSWFSTFFGTSLKEGYIMTLGVSPQYRRNHLGTYLLQELVKKLQGLGCVSVTLHVQLINNAAVRFYERNGFLVDEVLPNHYLIDGVYYDALKLRLTPTRNNSSMMSESENENEKNEKNEKNENENENESESKQPPTWREWLWWVWSWVWPSNSHQIERQPISNNFWC